MSLIRDVNIAFQDTQALGAFSRLRVVEPVSIFDSFFQYGVGDLRYNAITATGGTVAHLPLESSAQLTTIASAGSAAALQSKAYHRYIPGKSQLCIMTFVMGAAQTNVIKRAGYFDANDGIFLEQNGATDVAVVRRTSTSGSVVDNRVAQASWNVDVLDGSGSSANPSGLLLDLSKSQILVIDLQWLGSGRVRVAFDIGGIIVPVHQFVNANSLSLVYMRTANLPVRWAISSPVGAVGSMKATCATVVSEGGFEKDQGFTFSGGTELTARSFTAGTPLPVIALRPMTTFNSLTNRIGAKIEAFSWLPTSGTNDFRVQLIYNCAITGGAWSAVDANSMMEINRTGTALTGGIVLNTMYDNASNANRAVQSFAAQDQRYPWVYDGAGNQIVMALVFTEVSGSSEVQASMQWRELR